MTPDIWGESNQRSKRDFMTTTAKTDTWAIVRTSQKGAVFNCSDFITKHGDKFGNRKQLTAVPFNQAKFDEGVATPIRKLLDSAPSELKGILVGTCADPESDLCEEVNGNDCTPSTKALFAAFGKQYNNVKIIPFIVKNDWGLNAGSVTPLNIGIELARKQDANRILLWSPEIGLDAERLQQMMALMTEKSLNLVGYMRENWESNIAWQTPQNTIALWDETMLSKIGGFDKKCNGTEGETVPLPSGNSPLIAGMEDFDAYLKASALYPPDALGRRLMPWGRIGANNPISWSVQSLTKDHPEYQRNADKIARQPIVMAHYLKDRFPKNTKTLVEFCTDMFSKDVCTKIG